MIAVCITTYNRKDTFYRSLHQHVKYLPDDAMLIIVDDGSEKRPTLQNIVKIAEKAADERRVVYLPVKNNQGVAAAKNTCLDYAFSAGADHIFLFDDDTYPIAPNWWSPYVESIESHLMYQFRLPGNPANDMRELYHDDKHIAYSHTRGAMIYVERVVLQMVGGMDTSYGKAMYEHTDWTNRIHNAGLTTYRAMDVVGSDKLLYCLDQDARVESSIPNNVRRIQKLQNALLYRKSKTSKEFKEFRS